MGDVLVDAVPPSAVHLCVDMQRFFSSGLPLTVFRFRKELAYVFEASLQHLIKDGSRTSPWLCGP